MANCPSCYDDEGRPRVIPVTVTRWTVTGTATTLRCPACGWQDTHLEPELTLGTGHDRVPDRDTEGCAL